jgi:8-oxo-dGTP pyrophosphatase MutT (NUDIX family)
MASYARVFVENSGKISLADVNTSVWHSLGACDPYVQFSKSGHQVIVESAASGFQLYAPSIPSLLDQTFYQPLGCGSFLICSNVLGQLLLIEKKAGKFWYVPGGLVETKDDTIWEAGKREVAEETGIADVRQRSREPLFAYESVTPKWHNLMVFYAAYSVDESSRLQVPPSGANEISSAAWRDPAEFYAEYLRNPKLSVPNIELVLRHLRDHRWKTEFSSSTFPTYELFRKRAIEASTRFSEQTALLYDLCFLQAGLKQLAGCDAMSLLTTTNEMFCSLLTHE